jgi:hypothetical protein
MPFVTLVSLVLLGGVVGLLCFNTQMQQASFAATSLEAQADNLTAREQTLHAELQDLRSPQHLATLAQEAGMVIPQSACTVRLAAGTTEQGCAAATADNTPPLWPKPPKKPTVLNPAPFVVLVAAPPTATGKHHGGKHHGGKHHGQDQQGQGGDTARR